MGKIQQIKRTNGSVVTSINLPREIVEAIGWKKGKMVKVELMKSLYDIPAHLRIWEDVEDGLDR